MTSLEIVHVVGEIAHVPLARIASSRDDPPCPRESNVATAKPRRRRSFDRLEILLDELGAPVQEHDSAAHRRAIGRKPRIAELDAVVGGQCIDHRALRNRIARDFDETGQAGPKRLWPPGRRRRETRAPEIKCPRSASKSRGDGDLKGKGRRSRDRRPYRAPEGALAAPDTSRSDDVRPSSGQMRLRERISPVRALTIRK